MASVTEVTAATAASDTEAGAVPIVDGTTAEDTIGPTQPTTTTTAATTTMSSEDEKEKEDKEEEEDDNVFRDTFTSLTELAAATAPDTATATAAAAATKGPETITTTKTTAKVTPQETTTAPDTTITANSSSAYTSTSSQPPVGAAASKTTTNESPHRPPVASSSSSKRPAPKAGEPPVAKTTEKSKRKRRKTTSSIAVTVVDDTTNTTTVPEPSRPCRYCNQSTDAIQLIIVNPCGCYVCLHCFVQCFLQQKDGIDRATQCHKCSLPIQSSIHTRRYPTPESGSFVRYTYETCRPVATSVAVEDTATNGLAGQTTTAANLPTVEGTTRSRPDRFELPAYLNDWFLPPEAPVGPWREPKPVTPKVVAPPPPPEPPEDEKDFRHYYYLYYNEQLPGRYSPLSTQECVQLLLGYHTQHGNFVIPKDTEDHKRLRIYYNHIRSGRMTLSDKDRQLFLDRGFIFESPLTTEQLQQAKDQFLEFYRIFNKTEPEPCPNYVAPRYVPFTPKECIDLLLEYGAENDDIVNFKAPQDTDRNKFLHTHWYSIHSGHTTIHDDDRQRLHVNGFLFNRKIQDDIYWKNHWREIQDYQKANGVTSDLSGIAFSTPEYKELALWIRRQRKMKIHGKLRPDRQALLEQIGFPFDPKAATRERKQEKAAAVKEQRQKEKALKEKEKMERLRIYQEEQRAKKAAREAKNKALLESAREWERQKEEKKRLRMKNNSNTSNKKLDAGATTDTRRKSGPDSSSTTKTPETPIVTAVVEAFLRTREQRDSELGTSPPEKASPFDTAAATTTTDSSKNTSAAVATRKIPPSRPPVRQLDFAGGGPSPRVGYGMDDIDFTWHGEEDDDNDNGDEEEESPPTQFRPRTMIPSKKPRMATTNTQHEDVTADDDDGGSYAYNTWPATSATAAGRAAFATRGRTGTLPSFSGTNQKTPRSTRKKAPPSDTTTAAGSGVPGTAAAAAAAAGGASATTTTSLVDLGCLPSGFYGIFI